MICVVIKKSCWETTDEILHHITLQKKPTDFRFAMTLKDAVVGNVSNGSLWLQKTRPHYWSFPQRYFRGTISQEDAETTKIVGKFCYCQQTVVQTLCLSIITAWIAASAHEAFSVLCWWVIAFFWIVLLMGILRYRKEERALLNWLQSL